MVMGFGPRSGRPSMSGASAAASATSFRNGPIATCTMSACPGATSFTKPKSRFGGLKQPPRPAPPPEGDAGHRLFVKLQEPAMIALRLNDLRQHSDVLRLRSGKALTVRFV